MTPDPASKLVANFTVSRDQFDLSLDLTVEPGTTLALLGPNGAGKSTATAALAGLLPIEQGSIELGGRVLDRPSAASGGDRPIFVPADDRNIGVVFQDYALFPHLSVLDNVAFGLRHGRRGQRDRTTANRVAHDWLERLGIETLADKRPSDISGGQAQRVALARALAIEPSLLLLDEPLSALDVSTRIELRRVLREHLASVAAPRVLISHDPTDAFLLADTVCVIEAGRQVQFGTPEQIRTHPATSYVADLAGSNLLEGTSSGTEIVLGDTGAHLTSATHQDGAVLLTIRPNAVTLHRNEPEGSQRNHWTTTVRSLEPLGDITRVRLDSPIPIVVDVTPSSANDLGLTVGSPIWAAIKATEIAVALA